MTSCQREHLATVLIYREGAAEPDAVFVSVCGQRIGLGVAGGGDAEVWVDKKESQSILISLRAAIHDVTTRKEYETFNDIYFEQRDDYGRAVPAIVLVTNHRGEIGLYISIRDNGGGQVWMDVDRCEKVVAALTSAIEHLAVSKSPPNLSDRYHTS